MLIDTQNDNSTSLSGYISSIPLTIEDNLSKSTIKTSKLFLHSSKSYTNSDDLHFNNISLTGICHEGSFNLIINKENCQTFKKSKRNFNKNEWESIILDLFPVENQEINEISEYNLSAKLVSSSQNYDIETKELVDDADGEIDDFITIDIKTKSKLPITIGSLTLKLMEDEVVKEVSVGEIIKNEQDLFNWMGLLVNQNKQMISMINDLQQRKETLEKDMCLIQTNYEISKIEHERIVEDLQNKFYQVLNAKKDKIWELQSQVSNNLTGLNEVYIQNNRSMDKLLNIDPDKIPEQFDEKYTSPRKRRPGPRSISNKRRRAHPEDKNRDDNVSVIKADPGINQKPSNEVKIIPRSPSNSDSSPSAIDIKSESTSSSFRISQALNDKDIIKSVLHGPGRNIVGKQDVGTDEDELSQYDLGYEDNSNFDNESLGSEQDDNQSHDDLINEDRGNDISIHSNNFLDPQRTYKMMNPFATSAVTKSHSGSSNDSSLAKSVGLPHDSQNNIETDYSSEYDAKPLNLPSTPTAQDAAETDYHTQSDVELTSMLTISQDISAKIPANQSEIETDYSSDSN